MTDLPPANSDSYFVLGRDGRQHPVDYSQLREWAAERRISTADQVFSRASGQWRKAGDLVELREVFAGPVEYGDRSVWRRPARGIGAVIFLAIATPFLTVVWLSARDGANSASPEPAPEIGRGDREAHLRVLVSQMSPLFDDYEIVGPASVHVSVNSSAWNTLSRDQQRQLMDGLASKQIVRDIGATLHLRVMSTEVGTIGPGWSGEWRFRRAAE